MTTRLTDVATSTLLAPVGLDLFLGEIYGRRPHYFEGPASRFERLFGWEDLNAILRHHRLAPPRLRLADLDRQPGTIVTWQSGPKGEKTPRLASGELRRALAEGATLVLDAVEEIHPPVTRVADDLSRTFGVPVQVNLYVGTRQSQGFGTHRDSHDVFILQVWGSKRWTLYDAGESEAGAMSWTGLLTSGDVLYIPRGWWHDVRSVGGPTLHLTFGVPATTGSEYLAWVLGRLPPGAGHSSDVPRFASDEARAAYVARLREAIDAALTPSSLAAFLCETHILEPPRVHASLPWSVAPEEYPIVAGTVVRATYLRTPLVEPAPDGQNMIVRITGRQWQLPPAVTDLLVLLADGRPRSVDSIAQAMPDLPPDLLYPVLTEFMAQDLVEVAPAADEESEKFDDFLGRP